MSRTKLATLIIKLITLVLIIGMALFLYFQGWLSFGSEISGPSGPYIEMGTYSATSKELSQLNINWTAGDLEVIPYDGDIITFTEYAPRELKENEVLSYTETSSLLTIGYKQDGKVKKMPYKKLVVKVPKNIADTMTLLTIKTVSTDTQVSDFTATEMSITTTSGTLNLSNLEAQELTIKSVSGDMTVTTAAFDTLTLKTTSGCLTLGGFNGRNAMVESVSGDITLDGDITDMDLKTTSGVIRLSGDIITMTAKSVSGDIITEGSLTTATIKTTSGSIKLDSTVTPESYAIESVSGSVNLTIPEDSDLTVGFKSVSGSANSPFPTVTGPAGTDEPIYVKTTSGSLNIKTPFLTDTNTN